MNCPHDGPYSSESRVSGEQGFRRASTATAMAKQKAKPKGSRKRAEGQAPAQDTKPNLFERLYNRKKFDILGKKTKGERQHGQSVHDAVDKVSISCITVAAYMTESCSGEHTASPQFTQVAGLCSRQMIHMVASLLVARVACNQLHKSRSITAEKEDTSG